ncbi:MAG: Xaa-Pro aminopeptidase, partial [Polaribacter sp.]|nr:Xaa-Pro aminopeptidase [Polaribacter sp.]
MKFKIVVILVFCIFFSCTKKVLVKNQYSILEEKDRAALKDKLLEDRFTNLLPELMDKSEIDMWLLISREYNEDPVLKTMLPATWL